MDIEKYISILWHRKGIILMTIIVSTLVVVIGLQYISPTYDASSTLRVATSRSGQVDYEDLLYADRLLKTFAEIAATPSVVEEVVKEFALSKEPKIEVQVLANTELIRITVSHENPVIARDVANFLASNIIKRSQEIDTRLNIITVIDPAVIPDSPSTSIIIIVAAGVLVGLLGGIGLAFMLELLGKRLYTTKQVEATSGFALLGQIPPVKKGAYFISNGHCPLPYMEAFRTLRTNLIYHNQKKHLKTLLITSPDPGAGKSTILANLAVSMAQAKHKTVLIDGDLRKPKLHKICQVSNQVGLSDLLEGKKQIDEVLQWVDPNMGIISSGFSTADPTLLLSSEKLSGLIAKLSNDFEYVLIDSPAIFAVPDAKLLARQVDGLLLVINIDTASESIIEQVKRYLGNMPVDTIGMVINKAELNHSYYYYK